MTKPASQKVILAFLFLFFQAAIVNAQITFQKTFGGLSDDYGTSVQQTADGGYIITGSTNSFGAGDYDVYLIKTDANGDTLWTKTYGGTGPDYGYSVQQTTDGGYIITGSTLDQGLEFIYLIKTDSIGGTLWTKSYGEISPMAHYGYSVQQTTDGGYIITGYYPNDFGGGFGDVYLIKTDSIGDTLWTKGYGGGQLMPDYGYSVQQTADGGYIITGYTSSLGGGKDVYLIKTNFDGDTVWTKTYGGTSEDIGYSVQQTADGGYIITGCFNCLGTFGTGGVYLVKTNANGDTLWTKTYGGTSIDLGRYVQQTTDGGYIITGYTESFGTGIRDVYLIKTDASGNILWTRTFGGTKYAESNSVQQTADGGYILTGHTDNFGTGSLNVYLIKTDANGNIGCATINTTSTQVSNPSTIVGSGGTVNNVATIVNNPATIVSNPTTEVVNVISILPQPICLITVDSTSTRNVIIWEKAMTQLIDSFKIYREIGLNNYVVVGNVAYSDVSEFFDTTNGVNPNVQSYRYKMSVLDTCGNESALSDFHRTIHLSTPVFNPPSTFDLIWTNDYEGFFISQYYVLRDDPGGGNWVTIDSVTFGNLSYTDLNAPSPNSRHIITTKHPNGCTSGKQKNWNSSKSNTSAVGTTGALIATATSTDASIGICDGTATVIASGGTPPYSYLWDGSAGFQSTITAVGLCPGTYVVTVTDADGNTSDAAVIVSEYTTIVEHELLSGVKVYPNPNSGKFLIEFLVSRKVEQLIVNITNSIGQSVYKKTLGEFTGLYQETIDLKKKAVGVYELQLIIDGLTIVRKIIVQN